MPADSLRIVVLDGDETGQELLQQALRVLTPSSTRPRPGSGPPIWAVDASMTGFPEAVMERVRVRFGLAQRRF